VEPGHTYDLNTLIAPSALHLTIAEYINDQGAIVGCGVHANGGPRVFLLIRNPTVPLPPAAARRHQTPRQRGTVDHQMHASRPTVVR
jgi:hypothetical protein